VKSFTALFALCCALPAFTQNLPEQWDYQADNHRLVIGQVPQTGLYDRSVIREFRLYFDQPNYWTLLTQSYNTTNYVQAVLAVDGVVYANVGVQFRGQTSYSQVQNSQKKSFSIKTNAFVDGQHVEGYNNFNLNNSFGDPSFMREFLFYGLIRKHVPAAKCTYVRLYINDESWGLYPSVQQLNRDFLEEWYMSDEGSNWRADNGLAPGPGTPGGGWGDGTAALNYLGPNASTYQQYYTLKSTTMDDPWANLIQTCDVLNNTPIASLPQTLPAVLDIDRTLWVLAMENAFGDDDSYVYKGKMDYFCHWEKETGRMVIQEYDANTILGNMSMNWTPFHNSNNVNYPLLNRMLQVPAWRQRYIAHYRTILTELLNPAVINPLVQEYAAFIDAEVQADTKKLYSYTQFLNGLTTLQNNVNLRRNNVLNNQELGPSQPVIQSVVATTSTGAWMNPVAGETIRVESAATANGGMFAMNLFYSVGWVGNFTALSMTDNGTGGDLVSGDGIFTATLPGIAAGEVVRFYIEAVRNNATRTVSYQPAGAEHDVYILRAEAKWLENATVVINEVMADNATTQSDELDEYDDWIELYNRGTEAVNLSGWYLTDNEWNLHKWIIPDGTVLQPDNYLIIWADDQPLQGDYHCNFKLSKQGESLTLLTSASEISDYMQFGLQQEDMGYARVPNGIGGFVIQEPTFASHNSPVVEGVTEVRKGVSIYPNPVSDRLHFRMNGFVAQRAIVADMTGRVVIDTAVSGSIGQIDCRLLSSGTYVLRLYHTGGMETTRVIVR